MSLEPENPMSEREQQPISEPVAKAVVDQFKREARRMDEEQVQFQLRRFGTRVLRIVDAALVNEPQRSAVRRLIAEEHQRAVHNVFEFFFCNDRDEGDSCGEEHLALLDED